MIDLQKQVAFVTSEIDYRKREIDNIRRFNRKYLKQHQDHAKTLPETDREKYMNEVQYHNWQREQEIKGHEEKIDMYQSILASLKKAK